MASKNSSYIMVTSDGEYIGQGFFTPETARQYAVTYMQQNGVGITYAKVEGVIPFIPGLDDIDEADAMFTQHQQMKAAMNR